MNCKKCIYRNCFILARTLGQNLRTTGNQRASTVIWSGRWDPLIISLPVFQVKWISKVPQPSHPDFSYYGLIKKADRLCGLQTVMGMVRSLPIALLVILSLSFAELVSLRLPNLLQSQQDRFALNNKSLVTISFWVNCDQIPALLQQAWKGGDFQHLGGNKTKHLSQKAGSLFQPNFQGEQCLSINQGQFLFSLI